MLKHWVIMVKPGFSDFSHGKMEYYCCYNNSPEVSKNDERIKEGDFVDIEDYFQMEVVKGETVFVWNICNEGLDNKMDVTRHINNNHEILLSDNSYTDSESYEGFDEEGHRIIWFSVKLDLVQVDCTATSLETGRGRLVSLFYITWHTRIYMSRFFLKNF